MVVTPWLETFSTALPDLSTCFDELSSWVLVAVVISFSFDLSQFPDTFVRHNEFVGQRWALRTPTRPNTHFVLATTGDTVVLPLLPRGELLASLSDEMLARRAQQGDSEAFDVLVVRHGPALLRFVARTYPERAEYDDIVQETFIAAWKGLPSFAFRSQFRTWLYSLASRKTVDAMRRRRRDFDIDDVPEVADAGAGPSERALDGDFLAALSRELSQLPYAARAAWWLREVYDLPLAEIATVLRTTEGSVRGNLQRTRKRLAETLKDFRP
ncbi:RNA polymerase sigma factor [Mycobacteroides abscessus subsp. bolletii 50594]|uniref:RNA polymerase sigma factor n=2 Tax=Mycobacteroides abscessus TaxID=36809 RepID=A0AB33A7Y0_9MYCO|nr:RNA polymerase sigma factor [Mycobacteroides abscessus subsp. bolletii 50594]